MPNPITNFKDSNGADLGNKLITKEYLMTVYPQIANQIITPELLTWGLNDRGQLGDNTLISKSTPVPIFQGGANWKQASAGLLHTAAIKNNGTLWSWGYNGYGELAISEDDPTQRLIPVQAAIGGTNWEQVSCGSYHSAAVKTDGTLWTWGRNNEGQLGLGGFAAQDDPVQVSVGTTNWKQVACERYYTAAIKTDGTLWTWGYNAYGQLGDNTTIRKNTPAQTSLGGTDWKQVACGYGHTSAVKTNGTLWTWGRNNQGQLGNGTSGTNTSTPTQVSVGSTNWKQVACGEGHTVAIKTDGTLWAWGYNVFGQLGDNTLNNKLTPTQVFGGGTNWKQVSCGFRRTASIKTDGTLWNWGVGAEGQLGTNFTTNSSIPVQTFVGGTDWKQVSCGFYHTAAIRTSDNLLGI